MHFSTCTQVPIDSFGNKCRNWNCEYSCFFVVCVQIRIETLTSIVMAHADIVPDHVSHRSSKQMWLVHIYIDTNADCFRCADCIWYSNSRFTSGKSFTTESIQLIAIRFFSFFFLRKLILIEAFFFLLIFWTHPSSKETRFFIFIYNKKIRNMHLTINEHFRRWIISCRPIYFSFCVISWILMNFYVRKLCWA